MARDLRQPLPCASRGPGAYPIEPGEAENRARPVLQTVYVSVIKTHALLTMRQSRRI
ncbi:hypothetical protein [Paenibacillus apiarius]|uniref:Uncharacterized protein n=1 Tax=Paenibacillus apiarius TaxID=46240 RepID=A0ABT4DNR2_9BACL|nr:hypothetical protein [Paenibacillus apiarius]MCY9515467.1 hypothetical protein [Paenibacillus apiarius]MCY9518876.1 hypothetical protein [Paenibacillus apiarius]MCY9557247.1 hypothetical protein [Paenibacillus apiarius]MCY9682575.1 hypothetical protein [Paenibacillus apiarius]MCY9723947.1 hypothetical protein [Paenibacillus apiarius]